MSVDLNSPDISKTAALTALAAVAEKWAIRKSERHRLLSVAESTANHWFADLQRGELDDRGTLTPSVLERISHVVTIYDLLHRLVKGSAVDRWIDRPNPAFGGQPPRELLLSGRFDDLLRVRWYLEQAVNQ